jgi:hypothetical protein
MPCLECLRLRHTWRPVDYGGKSCCRRRGLTVSPTLVSPVAVLSGTSILLASRMP